MGQHLHRNLNAERNSSDIKTRDDIQLAVRTTRWASTCKEISTLNTTALSQKQIKDTGGNKAQQVGQRMYRDLNA